MPGAHSSQEARELMRLRRSTPADKIGEPGPDADTLEALLTIAARVPDHRRVTPFRFIVFEGDGREKAGDHLAAAFISNSPDAPSERVSIERRRFLRAPVVVAVVSCVNTEHRTPEWEQVLTAGAVCENLLIAACAYGFAAQWITEWYAYDQAVLDAFGLAAGEKIAGYIYIGAAEEDPLERARPDLSQILTRF